MSTAGAECVSAPTETKSAPVSASSGIRASCDAAGDPIARPRPGRRQRGRQGDMLSTRIFAAPGSAHRPARACPPRSDRHDARPELLRWPQTPRRRARCDCSMSTVEQAEAMVLFRRRTDGALPASAASASPACRESRSSCLRPDVAEVWRRSDIRCRKLAPSARRRAACAHIRDGGDERARGHLDAIVR